MTETKSLADMGAEVAAYCREKGWYDEDVPFMQAMALLHEEVAEAGHAWREHGLGDPTPLAVTVPLGEIAPPPPKPEGVGSEFADILIRLLDDDVRYGMRLEEYLWPDEEIYALDDNFLVNINTLHGVISRVSMAITACYESPHDEFAAVLSFLRQLCKRYGIDLQAEYERKMAYNHTRAYRHGGRRA